MIVELVLFDLPQHSRRDDALARYRQSAAKWAENPELIEKYYLFDEEKGLGGGVYIWPSREAAHRWHGADYEQMIQKLYGSVPRIQIFDALLHVDPTGKRTKEL